MKKLLLASLVTTTLFVIGYFTTTFVFDNTAVQQTETVKRKTKTPLIADGMRFYGPEKYAYYHHAIRTGAGQKGPTYTPNYQHTALEKAKADLAQKRNKQATVEAIWTERGPNNVPGRTRGIAVDPTDPTNGTWFAGSVGGGIWKTNNFGQTWRELTVGLPNIAISEIVIPAVNPQVIYAGTGEGGYFNVDAINGSGLLKSTDGGETWALLESTIDFINITSLVVNPVDENELLVCIDSGINERGGSHLSSVRRSRDGGQTWEEVYANFTNNGIQRIIANPLNFRELYISVNSQGIAKSVDGGDNWQTIFNEFLQGERIEIALAPSNPTILYASVERIDEAPLGSALYVSTDSGLSWEEVNRASGSNIDWLQTQGWYDNAIVVHPFNPNIVYVAGIDVWKMEVNTADKTYVSTRMTNGYGSSPNSYVHVDQHTLVTVPEAGGVFRLLLGNDGGVYVTDPSDDPGVANGSWSDDVAGYRTTQFYGVDKKPGEAVYIAGSQDNGTWVSPVGEVAVATTNYTRYIGGDGFEAVWNKADRNKVIGGSQNNSFQRSLDGGNSWNFIANFSTFGEASSDGVPFISRIANSPITPDRLFTVSLSGVWRSDDFGGNWTLAETSNRWGFWSGSDVTPSLVDPNVVWAAGELSTDSRIQVSNDGGRSFTEAAEFDMPIGRVTGMATHPYEPFTAYAVFSVQGAPKILRTTDLGQSWEDISGFHESSTSTGFPDIAVYSLLVMPHDPNILWAGTDVGIFESVDNGQTWSYHDKGLPATAIWEIKVVDNEVVVATHGRGIWTAEVPDLVNNSLLPPFVAETTQAFAFGEQAHLNAKIELKDSYDQVLIWANGTVVNSLNNVNPANILEENIPINADSTELYIQVFKGSLYAETRRIIPSVAYEDPANRYVSDFNAAEDADDFAGSQFRIGMEDGFTDGAIHVKHPYPHNGSVTYTLKTPIIIAQENAIMTYRDMALVQRNGGDNVVVEAKSIGSDWQNITPSYNSNQQSSWRNAVEQGRDGSPDLFVTQSINLHDSFFPGEVITIRFRLSAGVFENAWGWAIDDVAIQPNGLVLSNEASVLIDSEFGIYPNPTKDQITIDLLNRSIPVGEQVQINVYTVTGQLVLEQKESINQVNQFNLSLGQFAKGMYWVEVLVGAERWVEEVHVL